MSTMAVSQNRYAGREEKASLMERIRKYFAEMQKRSMQGFL